MRFLTCTRLRLLTLAFAATRTTFAARYAGEGRAGKYGSRLKMIVFGFVLLGIKVLYDSRTFAMNEMCIFCKKLNFTLCIGA